MEFAFDPVKSASNLANHGIDFLAAQQLWTIRSSWSFRPAPLGSQEFW
jgi:uncharacterized DUF497 family protein